MISRTLEALPQVGAIGMMGSLAACAVPGVWRPRIGRRKR